MHNYVHAYHTFNIISTLFIQVQFVSSDGRSGNLSSPLIVECSRSAPLVKSLMTIVMCVVMVMLVYT